MTQPILYTDYNFDTLVTQLQNRLGQNQSAWKDMYRSSTGQMLIELFSAIGTLVLYYIERRAQESYIGTAQNYSSLVNLARLLNYIPRRNVSSTGTLRFSLGSPATKMVFIPKWTSCATTSGVNFLVSEDSVIMPGQSYVDAAAVQGTLVTITSSSTGSTSQEYSVKDTLVENSNIFFYVNDAEWDVVTSFINSTNISEDYVIRPELDGTVTIVTGNNVFGKAPTLGDTITIKYVKSLGSSGNVYSTGLITTLSSTIYDQDGAIQTVTVTNTTTFLGGDDADTVEDVRDNAPQVFASGDRAVTKADFKSLIDNYPDVADSNVWGEAEETSPDYAYYNQVQLCVLLDNWILPSVTFKNALSTYLYTKSLMTVRYSYVTPTILYVVPTLIVTVNTGHSLTYVQSQIEDVMEAQFNLGVTTKLGTSIYVSDIIKAIEDISGVNHSHVTLKIEKELTDTYNVAYNAANISDVSPLLPAGVEIYVNDTLVGVDDGVGGWTVIDLAYTITGSVNYATGEVLSDLTPAPGPGDSVYMRYQQNQHGDIVVSLDQICKWQETVYDSIAYTS